jgi:uncharacterized repeat protein (TIGR03803 family)
MISRDSSDRQNRAVKNASPWAWLLLSTAVALCSPAAAAKLEVLHEFSGTDGTDPTGGLTIDFDTGILYGTTNYGGTGAGTVFSLTPPPPGKHKWDFQVIYTFKGGFDGSLPETGLVLDLSGNLYGTTHDGSSFCGCGTVFKLTPPKSGTGEWTKTLQHQFTGDDFDGTIPSATPFFKAGMLWGTTGSIGGSGGTIYRLDPGSGAFTIIYNPAKNIGNFVGFHPQGVTVTGKGVIYGTAFDGEASGTVFTIDSGGIGKVLYDFDGVTGANPIVPPVRGTDGTLYGTTVQGGNPKDCPESPGCGTVWELPPFARLKVLHSFKFFTKRQDGMSLMSPVALDEKTGLVYGTTYNGGTGTVCGGDFGSCGTVFEVDDNRNYKVLWEFPKGGPAAPIGQLVFHDGALYGTSYDGGKACPDQHYLGCGTVWKLTP